MTETGEKWLKENLDIDLNEVLITDPEKKTLDTTKFLNDAFKNKSSKKRNLFDLGFDTKVLEDIYFNKNVIMAELKGKVSF